MFQGQIVQVHSLRNAEWRPGKELTLTLRLCSPKVLILGNKGEGQLGERGGYDSWSYAAQGRWNVNKVGVGLVRTSLGGSSHSEVLGVVQRLRKPVLVKCLQLYEKIPCTPGCCNLWPRRDRSHHFGCWNIARSYPVVFSSACTVIEGYCSLCRVVEGFEVINGRAQIGLYDL